MSEGRLRLRYEVRIVPLFLKVFLPLGLWSKGLVVTRMKPSKFRMCVVGFACKQGQTVSTNQMFYSLFLFELSVQFSTWL